MQKTIWLKTVMQAEEYLIAEVMKLTNGNQTAAAGLHGLTRPAPLNKRLKPLEVPMLSDSDGLG